MKVSLFTAGKDPHYALGLLSGLILQDIYIDFIGNDSMKDSPIVNDKKVNYLNLRGDQTADAPFKDKVIRVLNYYYKLIKYAAKTDSTTFHILWLNKFLFFDMTLLNVYYKLLGKKLVYTAHNINIRERDGNNTLLNKLSLLALYKLVDHIFVHTEKMKQQLIVDFKINDKKISVIPFGINNVMPKSDLTSEEAKQQLTLESYEKVILFFGNIAPYKGLENLILALVHLRKKLPNFKLIITGRIKSSEKYWMDIQELIEKHNLKDSIIQKIIYVPDEEVEVYFKAADVLILPYKYIFQSGVVFLAYHFGLPVIATDVGSLKEDINIGETGFICKPDDTEDMSEKIFAYFQNDLYKYLDVNRGKIIDYAYKKNSWINIGEISYKIYRSLIN